MGAFAYLLAKIARLAVPCARLSLTLLCHAAAEAPVAAQLMVKNNITFPIIPILIEARQQSRTPRDAKQLAEDMPIR